MAVLNPSLVFLLHCDFKLNDIYQIQRKKSWELAIVVGLHRQKAGDHRTEGFIQLENAI